MRPALCGDGDNHDTFRSNLDGPGDGVVLGDLVTPTSMVLDPATGEIFISELATGSIKQYKIP